MPDSRGHGGSSASSAPYDRHELASHAAAKIELGLEQPVLLGHSMGGMTAAVHTARGARRPRRTRDTRRHPGRSTFLGPQRQLEMHRSDVAERHRRALSRPKEARWWATSRCLCGWLADGDVALLQTAQALQSINPRLRIERNHHAGHGLHYDQPHFWRGLCALFCARCRKIHFHFHRRCPASQLLRREPPGVERKSKNGTNTSLGECATGTHRIVLTSHPRISGIGPQAY